MNKFPINCYRKRQATVESSNFGSESCAMKTGGYMVEALRYKIWMFGLPIYGSINALYDNEAVYKNTITPESILNNNQHSIA